MGGERVVFFFYSAQREKSPKFVRGTINVYRYCVIICIRRHRRRRLCKKSVLYYKTGVYNDLKNKIINKYKKKHDVWRRLKGVSRSYDDFNRLWIGQGICPDDGCLSSKQNWDRFVSVNPSSLFGSEDASVKFNFHIDNAHFHRCFSSIFVRKTYCCHSN